MSSTEHWVEDQLFKMAGMSDSSLVKMFIAMAKESKGKENCYRYVIFDTDFYWSINKNNYNYYVESYRTN